MDDTLREKVIGQMRQGCENCCNPYEVVEVFDVDGKRKKIYARCDCRTRPLRDGYNPYTDPNVELSPFDD